jgi:hypothetical protein
MVFASGDPLTSIVDIMYMTCTKYVAESLIQNHY